MVTAHGKNLPMNLFGQHRPFEVPKILEVSAPPFWAGDSPYISRRKTAYTYRSLRMQVCSKEGITPTFLFISDGIETRKNPIPSGGVWILRE